MRVEVVPYDEAWPAAFAALRAELVAALGAVPVVEIEHVGSTSVPGLAAKPVIDVDVVVTEEHLVDAVAAVVAAGYEHLGELGVPQREAFRAPPGGVRRNVYVTVEGCLSLRNHRALREVLRADPHLRDEYGALKLALSQREFVDIDEYVEAKSPVVQRILAIGGIGDEERAEIVQINTVDPLTHQAPR